jgi:phosphoribosyl-ATP pyrophosphohydrolase/phosphoribosyl-AMP cyclohydrolase
MKINFDKGEGLVPAIVQDAATKTVLMLGYMNSEALKATMKTGKVTFYSRSRKTLWTKGETSGNFLEMVEILADCDQDTILIKANPTGPVCHTGQDTCFNEINRTDYSFIHALESIIRDRKNNPIATSYTNKLLTAGIKKITQKVGEESTEAIIEALTGDRERLKEETADLVYHLLVMLCSCDIPFSEVEKVLEERHGARGRDYK